MLLDRLKLEIEQDPPTVVSFDFFDTLCLRRTENPTAAFYAVAERLKRKGFLPPSFTSERFVALRVDAESRARRSRLAKAGTPEVSLRDIYFEFQNFSAFKRPAISDACAIEESVELENTILYDRMLDVLRLASSLGCVTAIVSDSYFSQTFFTRLFDLNQVDAPTHFFISNEMGAGKGSGAWPLVLSRLNVDPHRHLHIGDNYAADVELPSRLGVRTFFIPHGTSELFTSIAEERRFLNNRSSRYAATSVSTLRAKANLEARTDNPFVAYGYQTLGPIFSYYASWAQDLAAHAGAERIVPLAREGVFLAELMSQATIPVTRALSVSRRFMRIIDFRNPTRGKLDDLFATRKPLTRQGLWDRLSSLTGEFSPLSGSPPQRSGDDLLSHEDTRAFLDALWADAAAIGRLRERATEQARRFREHLESTIEPVAGSKRTKIALIDIGWNASIQKFLVRFCAEEGLPFDFVGLYAMTTSAANSVALEQSETHGFLIDGGTPTELADAALRNLEILEQSTTPVGIGSLLEFAKSGAPREMAVIIPEKQRQQIEALQEGISSFNSARMRLHQNIEWTPDIQDEIRSILLRAMVSPNEAEVALFSDWKHDDNILEESAEPIIEDVVSVLQFMTPRDFLAIGMAEQYWPFPNLTRGPDLLRKQVLSVVRGSEPVDAFENPVGEFEVSIFEAIDAPTRVESAIAAVNLNGRGLLKIIHAGHVDHLEIRSQLPDHSVRFSALKVICWDQEFKQASRLEFLENEIASVMTFALAGGEPGGEVVNPGDKCNVNTGRLGVPFKSGQTITLLGYEVVPSSLRVLMESAYRQPAVQEVARAKTSAGEGWIDSINGIAAMPDSRGIVRLKLPKGSDTTIEVVGWFLGSGDSTSGTTMLAFENTNGKRVTAPCIRTRRPDLSIGLKRTVPDDGGIRARINIGMIDKKGLFRIVLIQLGNNTTSSYIHAHPITLE